MKSKRRTNKKGTASILEEIKNMLVKLYAYIMSDNFLNTSRESKKYFTRKRKMPFFELIKFILNFRTKSTQAELNIYYDNKNIKIPQKCTFFKARLKLKAEAFLGILEKMVNLFYEVKTLIKKWKGYRLVASDMSCFTIPLTGSEKFDKELIDYFGEAKSKKGGVKVIQGNGQILYDPLNKFIIDGILTTKSTSERKILSKQIKKLGKGDLLLLDRGFPAAWLFALLKGEGIHFVARVKNKFSKKTDKFLNSKKNDKIIILKILPKKVLNCPLGIKIKKESIKIRLLKIKLEGGEIEILATSLLNRKDYPRKIFKELYFKRWTIENVFDVLKNKLHIEFFSGKRVKVILQDFYAKLIQRNLYRLLEICSENKLKKKTEEKQYEYAINENIGYNILKNRCINLLCEATKKIIKTIKEIVKLLINYIEPIRPGRSYERIKKKPSKTTIISFVKRVAI